MARKIKFALEMADGTFVSNLEDLQKHIKNNYDFKKLVEYFLDGRLEKWLLDRYYEEEAKALQSVDKDAPDFTCKLCKAIGTDYTPSEPVNVALIEHEIKIRKALEKVSSDDSELIKEIIANVGCIASTQSELDFLIKNGKQTIYLWGNSFKLPLVHNISYIGILGKPSVDIDFVDLDSLKSYGIKFENLNLPESIIKAEEEVIRRITEEARRKVEEEAKRRAEEEARRNLFKNANVGDIVKFGNYPQTSNGDIQPIEWQVLSKENNKMLVISKYGLDCKIFDSSSDNWANSEIRNWLNGEFYNKAFNEKEKKSIKSSNLSDVGTTDNVFLLSGDRHGNGEVNWYFANNEGRRCKATEYAVKNGGYVADNGYSWWWLCSPVPNISDYVYCVVHVGFVGSSDVHNDGRVVRPALWINLSNTFDDAEEEARRKAEEEARRKAEEARRKANPFINANIGDYVEFGNYPQGANGEIKPIEWLVLEKENNRMRVISKYGLEARRFDSSSNNWKNSEIRQWLNDEFYNKAFDENEKKLISSTNVSTIVYEKKKKSGLLGSLLGQEETVKSSELTKDKVFILSKEKAEKYFVNDNARRCRATEYAVKNGAYVDRDTDCWWWLRSPYPDNSRYVYCVCNVIIDGGFGHFYVPSDNYAVRPAMWIKI